MTLTYQVTDARPVLSLREAGGRAVAAVAADETSGTYGVRFVYCSTGHEALTAGARSVVAQLASQEAREKGQAVLKAIEEALARAGESEGAGRLPPVVACSLDDGAALIEWVFRDFRAGFSIEPDPKDTGWYLVSTAALGDISASGYLLDSSLYSTVEWLVAFVLRNA